MIYRIFSDDPKESPNFIYKTKDLLALAENSLFIQANVPTKEHFSEALQQFLSSPMKI